MSDYFGAPWVGANIDLLGRYETDPELNARYVPEWAHEGLPGYKTLIGNAHAWCILRWNADKRKVGATGTGRAAASSMSTWGDNCPFWFGAGMPIKHASGGRHAADFLYWIDQAKGVCATLDGNRGNRFAVNVTTLAKGHDRLINGPRWPKSYPPGQLVSMADVIAKYPHLKVTGSGSSGTR